MVLYRDRVLTEYHKLTTGSSHRPQVFRGERPALIAPDDMIDVRHALRPGRRGVSMEESVVRDTYLKPRLLESFELVRLTSSRSDERLRLAQSAP
jgi:hypothetical protein